MAVLKRLACVDRDGLEIGLEDGEMLKHATESTKYGQERWANVLWMRNQT